jgi:hypothetical protein
MMKITVLDYLHFYNNIKDDVAKRITAYKAN